MIPEFSKEHKMIPRSLAEGTKFNSYKMRYISAENVWNQHIYRENDLEELVEPLTDIN